MKIPNIPNLSALDINAIDPKTLLNHFAASGFFGLIGGSYIDHGKNFCELKIDWREDLTADSTSGTMASGAVITLMDTAAGISVWLAQNSFFPMATLDLRVDYLRPSPQASPIFGRCECYRLTRRVAFVRGIAHNGDSDDPLAFAAGTFVRTDISS